MAENFISKDKVNILREIYTLIKFTSSYKLLNATVF